MQKEEFSSTVLVHKNKMYRFAMSYLKVEDEAKDVVQDVLLRLWETREELSLKVNLEAWCMTLVRNKSLDNIKRVGRKMKTDLEETNPLVFSHDFSPMKVVTDMESTNHIVRLAAHLPEKQQASFLLRDLEGFAYHEISEMLNININQVKVNIFRARRSIKDKLEKIYRYGL